MKKIVIYLILIMSCNIIAMDPSWKGYDADDEGSLNIPLHPKKSTCSKIGAWCKSAAPILCYTSSVAIIGIIGYYAGSELKQSCEKCSNRLEDAEKIFNLAKSCSEMAVYALEKCPAAIQTCSDAVMKCINGGN